MSEADRQSLIKQLTEEHAWTWGYDRAYRWAVAWVEWRYPKKRNAEA